MRVLILSVFLACAAAAPSVVPIIPQATFLAAIPVPAPTIPSGDIQAAAIDAQVKAEDQARAFADQARELAEQAVENQNEGVVEANDLAKERADQAFWNAEEQKWQALDAANTAQAQADAVAARSVYIPQVEAALVPVSNEGQAVLGPATKAAETPAAAEIPAAVEMPASASPEAIKTEEQVATVKMAEVEKPASEAEKPTDSVQVESADLKTAAPENTKIETQNPFLIQTFPHTPVFAAPLSIAPLAYNQPFVAPVAYIQPGLKAVAPAIHPIAPHFVAPTVLKTQW